MEFLLHDCDLTSFEKVVSILAYAMFYAMHSIEKYSIRNVIHNIH